MAKLELVAGRIALATGVLALCTLIAAAAEILKLPRTYGPLTLAMSVKEFYRATGLDASIECTDCIAGQNVVDLEAKYLAQVLDRFAPSVRTKAPVESTAFFYKGKLESVLFVLTDYDYAATRVAFERTLGTAYKREVFQRKCIYSGGEMMTWSDAASLVSLTEYRDASGAQLEIKLADKALLEQAEKLRELADQEILKRLEASGDCR